MSFTIIVAATLRRRHDLAIVGKQQGGNATENPFTDVKESDFYYKAVLWAVENGITNGLTATTFGPDAICNRAQVVTFLYWTYNK